MTEIKIPFNAKPFYAWQNFVKTNKPSILVMANEESAIKAYKQLQFFAGDGADKVLYFPSFDTLPYDRTSPHPEILARRAHILSLLSTDKTPRIVAMCATNLVTKVPPRSVFTYGTMHLKVGDKVTLESFVEFLANNNFTRASSAVDSSDFAVRGEIVDFVTTGEVGYRVNFGWQIVESIKTYDTISQISKGNLSFITINSPTEAILNLETVENFKVKFLKNFGVNNTLSPLYNAIIEHRKFQGYENLLPLFFNEMELLQDFMADPVIISDNLSLQKIKEYERSYQEQYEARKSANNSRFESFYYTLPPSEFLADIEEIQKFLPSERNQVISGGSEYGIIQNNPYTETLEDKSPFDRLFETVEAHQGKVVVIFCNAKSSVERIKTLAQTYYGRDLIRSVCNEIEYLREAKSGSINIAIKPLSGGFYNERYLFIAEQDIVGAKFTSQSHKTGKKKLKNILLELDSINEGDFIVHEEHGIGQFVKIETLEIYGTPHDCLKILYQGNDILYLPVENIEAIKKYGSDDAVLDKLGNLGWQKRKARLKERIKDIADKLLKIAASRKLLKNKPIMLDSASYEKFCQAFPYSETEDQLAAINDVQEDLASDYLMDRLICGDVGFGKTEVAMRAAFMLVSDVVSSGSQVAVIAPTTILCRQHYESFIERFKAFPFRIASLSRLVKPSDAARVKQDLKDGKIDIIIGTHAMLAKGVEFNNLKMLIIDEEQQFGVAQKERLKELKNGVHVLSLSATPIPRTLQMSMVGIKDLSLIATPPIDRLPVRTTITQFDPLIIKDALTRERLRGGRSFYVCPRIKDINDIEVMLREFMPEVKYVVAHGQMPAATIDKTMNDFCDGKYDVLLSTTIIQSGIDIASVNTIIIHNADMLGLSQLYQLRGRVGRGKIRGYAYLSLSARRVITKYSLQRLEILQNIDSLGAGFTIASHDMDMRGFGNLVGEEQSGHIKEVGVELYQEMLDAAMLELKGSKVAESKDFVPNINIGLPVLIPANYIMDSSLRLAIYRRVGQLRNRTEIDAFTAEMIDRFGVLPVEFSNLLEIVSIKHKCLELKIESIDSGPNGFVFKFHKAYDVSDMVMSFVSKNPRITKIQPDNKLIIIKKLTPDIVIDELLGILRGLEGG